MGGWNFDGQLRDHGCAPTLDYNHLSLTQPLPCILPSLDAWCGDPHGERLIPPCGWSRDPPAAEAAPPGHPALSPPPSAPRCLLDRMWASRIHSSLPLHSPSPPIHPASAHPRLKVLPVPRVVGHLTHSLPRLHIFPLDGEPLQIPGVILQGSFPPQYLPWSCHSVSKVDWAHRWPALC